MELEEILNKIEKKEPIKESILQKEFDLQCIKLEMVRDQFYKYSLHDDEQRVYKQEEIVNQIGKAIRKLYDDKATCEALYYFKPKGKRYN